MNLKTSGSTTNNTQATITATPSDPRATAEGLLSAMQIRDFLYDDRSFLLRTRLSGFANLSFTTVVLATQRQKHDPVPVLVFVVAATGVVTATGVVVAATGVVVASTGVVVAASGVVVASTGVVVAATGVVGVVTANGVVGVVVIAVVVGFTVVVEVVVFVVVSVRLKIIINCLCTLLQFITLTERIRTIKEMIFLLEFHALISKRVKL